MGFSINQVTVSGNLTRDPETRTTGSGLSITSIAIAHNERRKVQNSNEWEDRPHFFDVTIFGGQGEWLGKNAHKGDPITVSGQLEQQRWQDKTSGENRSRVSIIARDIFLGQRGGSGGGQSGGGQSGYDRQPAGGYERSAPAGGDYGGAPSGGYDRQPAAAPAYGRGSDVAVDTSDFAPAPRGALADPGEDDIPF